MVSVPSWRQNAGEWPGVCVCARSRHPASVGQRRDDESRAGALILVPVPRARVDLLDQAVVLVGVPVEAQLHLPRERVGRVHLLLDHLVGDVAVVHVACDERHTRLALQFRQLSAHLARELLELVLGDGHVLGQRGHLVLAGAVGHQPRLHLLGPVDARDRQHDLRRVGLGPADPLLLLREPLLDGAARLEVLAQPDALALLGEHGGDVDRRGRVAKVELLDVVEALDQVWLHRLRVPRLGEDLEQLVVREEEEARESGALRLQVVLQVLLDLVERGVGLRKTLVLQHALLRRGRRDALERLLVLVHVQLKQVAQREVVAAIDLVADRPLDLKRRDATKDEIREHKNINTYGTSQERENAPRTCRVSKITTASGEEQDRLK
eukprot:6201213-Pleurochrysis_carterae.AAC.2